MRKLILISTILLSSCSVVFAATKISSGSGNWNSAATWSPSGVPGNNDSVVIAAGHTVVVTAHDACKQLTIASGATLNFTGGKKLTLNGTLTVLGTCNTDNGNLLQNKSGALFRLGPGANFNWQPEQNNLPHASLWTNSTEDIDPASNLAINAWYDAEVPLGSVVTGNFGNLTLSSNLPEWRQNDEFVNHLVKGTLIIDRDYIVLNDINSASSSVTQFNDVILQSPGSYLDFFQGTKTGGVTVNMTSLTINGGELNMSNLAGTANTTLNVTGNVIIEKDGQFIGANGNDGTTQVNISGNLVINGGVFKGCSNGDGNHTVIIDGNLENNISITAGEYYGIEDGNGNVSLHVSGNLINSGYMDMIWNSGFSGVGNGNATMVVNGSFTQSQGDFRGIYNLSTTNAGTISISVNSLVYSGGTFMGHYACHTGAGTNTYAIAQDLSITFSNSSDIFRLNGLNALAATQSTAAMTLDVGGNFTITGNAVAEFKSSASNGSESIVINGITSISGGRNEFNSSTSHTSTLLFKSNVNVSNGTTWLAYASGSSTINMNQDLVISGGILNLRNGSGVATVNISGNYQQTAGTFSFYTNASEVATEANVVNIYGALIHNGGTIHFSENASAGSMAQILNMAGNQFTLGGDGIITSSAPFDGSAFGKINYNCSCNMVYTRSGTHQIAKVSQYVNAGTSLVPASDIMIASTNTPASSSFYINSNATADMQMHSLFAGGSSSNASVRIDEAGTLKTSHPNGLFNGTNDATLDASNGMTFDLHEGSIVEYSSSDNQAITGLNGIAVETKNKYGILRIISNGTPDSEHAYINNGEVHVRTRLELTGELFLNDHALVIESGNTNAISVTSGFIKSETNAAVNNGAIRWMNMTPGTYIYPFGYNSASPIPVTIIPLNAGPSEIAVSTRATSQDNMPYAAGVSSVKSNGENAAAEGVIDRWWNITASASARANITLSYRGSENTTESPGSAFGIQVYSGGNWLPPSGSGTGVTSGTGSVTAANISVFGPMLLSGANFALPIELAYFNVQNTDGKAELKWATSAEKNNDFFTVERTADGNNWEPIEKIKGAGTTHLMKSYRTFDNSPLSGKSYYRLKQTDFNGDFTYSPVRPFNIDLKEKQTSSSISLKSIGPNPFTDRFTMQFNSEEEGEADIYINSVNGQTIHRQNITVSAGLNFFDYTDEKQIPPGHYIVTLIKGSDKQTVKIIKQ